jgi:hypothetical protein
VAEPGFRGPEGKQPAGRTDPLGRRPGEMTGHRQQKGPSAGTAAAANLGIVRPPLVYLSSVLTGIVVHLAWPLPFLPPALSRPVGSSLVVVAIALFSCSVRELWAAWPQADHGPCPDRPLSLQPESHLSGVLCVAPRHRDLGQQPVARRNADGDRGRDGHRGDPERGAVPGREVSDRVPGVQGLSASLAIGLGPRPARTAGSTRRETADAE